MESTEKTSDISKGRSAEGREMRRTAEASNKWDLLEKGRGWAETLDWFLKSEPPEREVREALEETGKWNPTDLRGRLYKHGRVEALEWLLGR